MGYMSGTGENPKKMPYCCHTLENIKTVAELILMLSWRDVWVMQPGPTGKAVKDGIHYFSGPHGFPRLWWIQAYVRDGVIPMLTKVKIVTPYKWQKTPPEDWGDLRR